MGCREFSPLTPASLNLIRHQPKRINVFSCPQSLPTPYSTPPPPLLLLMGTLIPTREALVSERLCSLLLGTTIIHIIWGSSRSPQRLEHSVSTLWFQFSSTNPSREPGIICRQETEPLAGEKGGKMRETAAVLRGTAQAKACAPSVLVGFC